MGKALIITSKNDEHADYIINLMNIRGYSDSVIRLNTEDFRNNVKYTFNGNSFHIHIVDSGKDFYDSDICSVWYRRPLKEKIQCEDEGVKNFIRAQTEHFINGLYYCLADKALWINDLKADLFAKNKLYQLYIAKEVGFLTPNVMISNEKESIDRFVDDNEMICNKSLSVPHYEYNGKQYPYMTRLTSKDDIIDNIESLNVCPTFFEGYIEKKYDIRVVVFGEKIYAFAIYSQENEMSQIDVRGISPLKLKHELIELPNDVLCKIRMFMHKQNLFFSSIDLLYSKKDQYYFIENNCNGQWLWLENMTGIDMSKTFIEALINGHYR